MGNSATLSSKYQISIPKSVRAAQNWKPGQKFAFIPKGGGVLLVPIPDIEDIFSIAPNADPTGYRDRDDRY